jgi:hypothetical protein
MLTHAWEESVYICIMKIPERWYARVTVSYPIISFPCLFYQPLTVFPTDTIGFDVLNMSKIKYISELRDGN